MGDKNTGNSQLRDIALMCDQILKPDLRRTVCLSVRRTGISNLELQGLNGRYLA